MNRSRILASAAIGVALAAVPWVVENPVLLALATPSAVIARLFRVGDELPTWQLGVLSVLNAASWAGVALLCFWAYDEVRSRRGQAT